MAQTVFSKAVILSLPRPARPSFVGLPAPRPPGAVIRQSRTTGPVAQVPPCYFLCGQKVTKKPPAPRAGPPPFYGGFSDTPAREELPCPVNKSFLRGSDLVVWLSTNSACRPLKGTEPARGASESLRGKTAGTPPAAFWYLFRRRKSNRASPGAGSPDGLRACLTSRRMPVDEGFFRQARRALAGIMVFISRDHNEAWREKTRQTVS